MAARVIDLTFLTSAQGFIIQGDVSGNRAGWSVSNAGDVNGDGIADVIVGARYGDNGGSFAGEAYVLFGKTSGFTNIDLSSFTLADGFIIQGDAANDQAAYSVSYAGDVNGDGIDDVIVGAPYGDDGDPNAGEAYVIFGKAGAFPGDIDVDGLTATDGFKLIGEGAFDRLGDYASATGAGAKGATVSLPVWRAFITVPSPPKAPASKICDQRNENHPLRTTSALAPESLNWCSISRGVYSGLVFTTIRPARMAPNPMNTTTKKATSKKERATVTQ